MEYLSVIVAGVGSFMFGAIWYSLLGNQWMSVSGVAVVDGKPANASDPKPYIIGLIAAIFMAGMIRHVFVTSGVDTIGYGAVSGLGIGLFLATPWIATCYAFAGRPLKLTLIDGGYATGGSTVAGIILTLF